MSGLFVPYDLSVLLMELGFTKKCIAWHDWTGDNLFINERSYVDIKPTPAPLWDQAFDWFREEHNLRNFIDSSPDTPYKMRYFYTIKFDSGYGREPFFSGWFDSHLEAKVGCLTKLIELIK